MMNHGVNVGINLGGITYYSSELKWVDIAKQSQEWITGRTNRHDWNTGETNKIQWRDDGYPVSLEPTLYVKKLVYRDFGDHEEDGNYTILYDGEGEIGISLTRPIIQYEGKGRIVATINVGKNGFAIEIRKTNPKNPIRNLRLLAPGYEYIYERFPYHPVFLENLKRYSEIRSMDFFSTNGHMPEPTTWATRRHSDYHTQAGDHGGAIEEFIHICNTLGASPWFNVPHAADDDFVRHMAQLAKDTVRPDLKIYIEYSNEVWNGMFRQGKYSQEQGLKLHMDTVSYKAGLKYYNKRSVEIMKLWKQVFGSSTSRLIPLYAWQTGFQDFYRKALDDLGSNINTFKAMAITGYFGCNKASGHSDFVKMSMADIEKLCENDLPNLQQKYEHYLNVSQAHGVKLLMYEGGPSVMESGTIQHHGQSHADITNHAIAFQKDSHIEKPVQDVLDLWYRVVTQSSKNSFPGGLFNYFSYTGTPTKYGSWGMFQYTGQDPHSVPKYRRVMNFINGRFPNLPLGPKCSFVKSGALAYGCFQETPGTFKCGQTDNNGRTWSYFPSLNQKHGEYLTLDGYNPKTSSLYIRVTDSIAANTYHVFNTRTRTFSSMDDDPHSPVWERRNYYWEPRIWRKDPLRLCESIRFCGYMDEIRQITERVLTKTARSSTFSTSELRSIQYGTRPLPTPNSTGSSVLNYNSLNATKLARLPDASILKLNLPPNSTSSSYYPSLERPRGGNCYSTGSSYCKTLTQTAPLDTQSKGANSNRSRTEKILLGFVVFLAVVVVLHLLLLFLVIFMDRKS